MTSPCLRLARYISNDHPLFPYAGSRSGEFAGRLNRSHTRKAAMKKTPTIPSLLLGGGTKIPQIGLGVWQAARGSASHDAVAAALRLGYRHVDTAQAYGNE